MDRYPYSIAGADFDGGGFFYNSQPFEGQDSAYNGFDGVAGLEYEL